MLNELKAALRRYHERARHRKEYLALLRLDHHLRRDTGIAPDELHARLDALGVPV